MEDNRNNQDKLEINVPAELLEGVYSNLAVITHSSAEFILDFIRVMPGTSKAPVKSRVVMAPEHAKRLLYALQNNVQKYEQVFGEIRFPGTPAQMSFNFMSVWRTQYYFNSFFNKGYSSSAIF